MEGGGAFRCSKTEGFGKCGELSLHSGILNISHRRKALDCVFDWLKVVLLIVGPASAVGSSQLVRMIVVTAVTVVDSPAVAGSNCWSTPNDVAAVAVDS